MQKLTILGITVFAAGLLFGIQTALSFTANPYSADWASRYFNYLSGFALSCGVMAFGGLLIVRKR